MKANRRRPPSPRARARSPRSFRGEIVALHRQIFQRNKQRINESVYGYTEAFRRYEREYARGVRTYQRRASFDELDTALAHSNVVYVGDFHTLPQAQRSFLRVLRRLPSTRPVILAMEFVQGRHQGVVDAFMAGELDAEAFLKGIGHDTHWVFGGWSSFAPIFELARERGFRVVGIDAAGQGPAGASLRTRDRYAAQRIADALSAQPEALVMTLVGELHIAPMHLPADVGAALRGRGLQHRPLLIYQNCENIYWQLERRGLEHEVELVRVRGGEYCLMNTPPIVCQQSFLNWVQEDDDIPELAAPEENFKEYVRIITSFFDLDIGDAVEEVELASVVNLLFLARLRRRGDFSEREMRQIRRQVLRSESYYIPRAKMVYLGNLSVNHAAEEATHFIRHVCSECAEPRTLIDAFYARALEEAIGFLGSKIINHKRKCTREQQLRKLLRARHARGLERRMARLALKHIRLETGQRVRNATEIYECDAETFNAVTHVLGYRLGERLYYALIHNHLNKQEARELFFDDFEEDGEAFATYLYLLARTADVPLPERL